MVDMFHLVCWDVCYTQHGLEVSSLFCFRLVSKISMAANRQDSILFCGKNKQNISVRNWNSLKFKIPKNRKEKPSLRNPGSKKVQKMMQIISPDWVKQWPYQKVVDFVGFDSTSGLVVEVGRIKFLPTRQPPTLNFKTFTKYLGVAPEWSRLHVDWNSECCRCGSLGHFRR